MDGGFILFLCLCGQLGFRDFDILNIFYDELEIEKMAKFEILIATNGLIKVGRGIEVEEM